ncbi:MAG TPA: nucleoside triphosphate pyrophosphatase [Steroidobacteraceae bacterium]|jgi:septum formation protein
MPADFVYLASASPRRRELLCQIGVAFRVLAIAIDERALPGEMAGDYVLRLARAKAEAGWALRPSPEACVLGADTAVVIEGEILGKPKHEDDCVAMLMKLAGRTHRVLTAVAVRSANGLQTALSESEVTFRALDAAEAESYWETGEPHDKAGGYAVQGLGAVFISALRGSFSGVMGLPLFETAELLSHAGVAHWNKVYGQQ